MNPKHPVYIVSKGRWESRLTSKALESMGVPYYIVVEPQEREQYSSVIDPQKILVLPQKYHDEYDPCTTDEWKSNGPGAARNFCWDHSIDMGAESHWVMDDNIQEFGRMNKNRYANVGDGTIFKASEDFVDRYENIALSGFQYFMFTPFRDNRPAFAINTRIYSCLLIKNNIRYRWRGRYNEDTDLSLRVLKDGWCTVQFNAFIQNKITTQTMEGGNTKEFYAEEGTLNKSKMIQALHPDVVRIERRFGRVHHYVNYSSFKKNNRLILKKSIDIPKGNNEYGMVKKEITNAKSS